VPEGQRKAERTDLGDGRNICARRRVLVVPNSVVDHWPDSKQLVIGTTGPSAPLERYNIS